MVTLTPPLSKSDAQRALVVADARGLPLAGVLPAGGDEPRDVRVLREGLLALEGAGDGAHAGEALVDCHDGGAPFRFLLAQAAVRPGRVVRFTGTARLGERPHAPLVTALRGALGPAGLRITEGTPWPLVVEAPRAFPRGVAFSVTGAESSQFASSLLLAAARLAADSGSPASVRLEGALTSAGYLALTERWLGHGGFVLRREGATVAVSPGRAPAALPPVPGDWSSLGYLLLLAWRSGCDVARVARGTGHPDEALADVLGEVGLEVSLAASGAARVTGVPARGFTVDAERCPDAVPTLVALATVLPAPSRVLRPGVLRHKESDRLDGALALVRAAGLGAAFDGEVLSVTPGRARDFAFDARDDHRLAMSAAVLAHLHGVTLRLRGKHAVGKSFPRFWDEAARAGLVVEEAS